MPVNQAAKNSGIVFFGRIFNLAVDFIVGIYLVRYLGSSDYGVYSLVFSYIFLFNFVSLSGMNKVLVREISKNEKIAKTIVGNALTLRILLPVAAILLSIAVLVFLNYSQRTNFLISIASITLLITSVQLVYQSIFQTFLKMEYSVFSDIIAKIIYLISIILVIFFNGSLIHIILGIVISSAVALFLNIIFSKKFLKFTFKFNPVCIKKIVKPSISLTIAGFFFVIYQRIGVLMISLMKDVAEVGLYSAAFKLTETLNMIPATLMMSFFPLMSRQFKNNKDNFLMLHEQGIRLMLIIGIPIAILMGQFSKEIVLLLFGSEFLPSSRAVVILVWAEIFIFVNFVYMDTFISIGRQTTVTVVTAIIAIVNVLLNYFLIPEYSFLGASWATLIGQALGSGLFLYYIHRMFPFNSYKKILAKLTCLALGLYLFLILFGFMPKYILVVLSLFFYVTAIIVLRVFPDEEIKSYKNILKIY